jgi:protein-tyrosine phosphatase
MRWLRFLGGSRRRRSPFNNLDASGCLTCGQVTAGLYVGGELGPRDWEALQAEGISVVVNLQHEQQDVWAPDENIEGYLWLPSPDGMAPSLSQLAQGVSFIRAAVRSGQKVFVHCKAGQGRAPLLCACYLIAEGAKPLEAIKIVREARPRTLLTPDQSARLREFAIHFPLLEEEVAPLPPQITTQESTLNGREQTNSDNNGVTSAAPPNTITPAHTTP